MAKKNRKKFKLDLEVSVFHGIITFSESGVEKLFSHGKFKKISCDSTRGFAKTRQVQIFRNTYFSWEFFRIIFLCEYEPFFLKIEFDARL